MTNDKQAQLQALRDKWYPIGHAFNAGLAFFFYVILRKDNGSPPAYLDQMQPLDIALMVCAGLCAMIGASIIGVTMFRCADWSRFLILDPGGLRLKYFRAYLYLAIAIALIEIVLFFLR